LSAAGSVEGGGTTNVKMDDGGCGDDGGDDGDRRPGTGRHSPGRRGLARAGRADVVPRGGAREGINSEAVPVSDKC
jgi:hypothetical protein